VPRVPSADIPVVLLSIDGTQPASFHHEIGKLTEGSAGLAAALVSPAR